jgi:hypothetical protein
MLLRQWRRRQHNESHTHTVQDKNPRNRKRPRNDYRIVGRTEEPEQKRIQQTGQDRNNPHKVIQMKVYAADYVSPANLFKGTLYIEAEDHMEAMSKFFKWIQTKEVWGHLWSINVSLKEAEQIEKI